MAVRAKLRAAGCFGEIECGFESNQLSFRNPVILQFMKATVTINSRGVVTLPAKLRQALGLKADDHLIAETTPEGLLLRPAVTLPLEMYTPQREREFNEAESELARLLAAAPPARARRAARGR